MGKEKEKDVQTVVDSKEKGVQIGVQFNEIGLDPIIEVIELVSNYGIPNNFDQFFKLTQCFLKSQKMQTKNHNFVAICNY